jgi:protein NrfD
MGMREPPPRAQAAYDGPTYYGQPAVTSSSYGALVWGYIYVAGLAGSSQVLATIADLLGRADLRGVVRQGRAMAAWLPVAGAGLLVADLKTPNRFYNMLRIFRATSPMSIGTYLLGTFGLGSIVTAWAGGKGRTRLATASELPAAAAGAGMSVYTGSLLAATSTPLWSAAPRLLAGRFGASAFATAAAALSIGETLRGNAHNAASLDRAMAVAALAEYGFATASARRYREQGVDGALHDPRIAAAERASRQLGVLLPLACVALNELAGRRSRALTIAGAVGVLAGGLLMRRAMIEAGNRSAQRPQDAFALAGGDRARRTDATVGGMQP